MYDAGNLEGCNWNRGEVVWFNQSGVVRNAGLFPARDHVLRFTSGFIKR